MKKWTISVSGRARPEHPDGCPKLESEPGLCKCEIVELFDFRFEVEAETREAAYMKGDTRFHELAPGLNAILTARGARKNISMTLR